MNLRIKDLIKKHFPFPDPRPKQLEAIEAICESFMSGKKHFILQAPTGIGKSAIAYTVHKVLAEISSVDFGKRFRTTIAAPTHNLQNQYIESFEKIDNLMGKKNYSCHHNANFYNSGQCRDLRSRDICSGKPECPYLIARTRWTDKSDFRITNTSMQIEMCDMVCNKPWNRANLIVCDESHRLEEMLTEHCSLKIDIDDVKQFNDAAHKDMMDALVSFINIFDRISKENAFQISRIAKLKSQIQKNNLSSIVQRHLEELDEMIILSTPGPQRSKLYELYETLQQMHDKTKLILNGTLDTVIINEYSRSKSIVIKPVYAGEVSYYGLFRKADFILHMSATIAGFEKYRQTLRIGASNFGYLDLENPIPLENRRVMILKNFKMSNGDGNTLSNMARCVKIISDRHQNQNGLIHTVSYRIAEELTNYLESDRLIISNDMEEATKLLSKGNGKVIVSPSFEEGIDLVGDLSRFQILVKTPFLFLGDTLIKYKTSNDSDWYARKTLIRTIQMCGRSVRGPTDYAKTYILDNTIIRVLENTKSITPKWFSDAITVSDINSTEFKEF